MYKIVSLSAGCDAEKGLLCLIFQFNGTNHFITHQENDIFSSLGQMSSDSSELSSYIHLSEGNTDHMCINDRAISYEEILFERIF